MASPTGVVAIRVVGGAAVGEGVVTQREHQAGNPVEQGRRGLIAVDPARGDVPRARDDLRRARGRHGDRDEIDAGRGVFVRHSNGHGELADVAVDVAGLDRLSQGGGRTGEVRAVAPGEVVRPGAVVRVLVCERECQPRDTPGTSPHIGAPIHRGRTFLDRRGRRGHALATAGVRDRERDVVRALGGVRVGWRGPAARRAVAEVPEERKRHVAVRIARRRAVERDGVFGNVRAARASHRGEVVGRAEARSAPRVGERLAGLRHELPVVSVGPQRQLQDAVGVVVPRLAVRHYGRPEPAKADAARADGELPDASVRVERSVGPLRREALVDVEMRVDDEGRPGGVQRLPRRLQQVIRGLRAG